MNEEVFSNAAIEEFVICGPYDEESKKLPVYNGLVLEMSRCLSQVR